MYREKDKRKELKINKNILFFFLLLSVKWIVTCLPTNTRYILLFIKHISFVIILNRETNIVHRSNSLNKQILFTTDIFVQSIKTK